ncbi:MAG: hypothetical protein ACR2J3_13190 [Aridibacter sp.]
MKIKQLFTIMSIGIIVSIISVNIVSQSNTQKKMKVKDIRSKGLTIIPASDPQYTEALSRFIVGDDSVNINRFINSIKPFSAILTNNTNQPLVAYRIKWELTDTSGKVKTFSFSDSVINYLMTEGVKIKNYGKASTLLMPGESRFISVVSKIPIVTSASPRPIPEEMIDYANMVTESLSNTNEVKVELEGAFFANGKFVGDPNSNFYDHIRAQVSAKKDILVIVNRAVKAKKDPFPSLTSIANKPDIVLDIDAKPADYYNQWQKLYAEELLNMRNAIKDDKKTLNRALRPFFGQWKKLIRENE